MTARSLARQGFLAAVSVLALARGAAAHDFWIEPQTYEASEGVPVALRLRVGERFRGDPVPRNDAKIEKFVIAGPSGETAVTGRDGSDPAGVARPAVAGIHVVGYRSKPSSVELEAEKFEAYLAEEGLESVIAERKEKGLSKEPGREIYSRCAKALLRIGRPKAPATGFDAALGFRLELVPVADPFALAADAALAVEVRSEGKPLADALVVARRKDAPDERLFARTGADGRVALKVGAPGVWLLKCVHMVRAPAESKADWESLWASLTFEVPTPAATPNEKGAR
jgi:uncharacterized GH25 family protein